MIEEFIGEIVPRFQKPGAAIDEDATPKAQSPDSADPAPGI